MRCMAADRPTLFRCCADQLAERLYGPRPAPFRRRFEACLQAGSFSKERLSRLRRAALAGAPAADATFRPRASACFIWAGPRGTAEQWIREGKNAAKWTRLSCRSMKANAVRLQLHALAYNMANFFRTLVLPDEVERWSLTTLREKVVKIGAKVIAHARYTVFQMAEVAMPRDLFRRIRATIDELRPKRIEPC